MADYTRTTIKLPQEVALSLDQQLTRQHNYFRGRRTWWLGVL